MKIAIVNSDTFGKYFPQHIESLSKFGEVERLRVDRNITGEVLAEKLKGFNIVIASITPRYDSAFFALNRDVALITRHGIGVDNINLEAATEAGVIIARTPGFMERESVAEHAVALLLQVARKINPAAESVKESGWKDRARFQGIEIRNKNAGIIGFGNIGSRVAEILKNGFGCRILVYDPNVSPIDIKRLGEPVVLDYLLKECDIILLLCSLNEKNYHMLGKREFSIMKKGAILVNISRGELIDEDALIESLEKGNMGGVGLDVVEGEPVGKNHPLLKFEEVVIVPHIAAYTKESLEKMGSKIVEDVKKIAGKEIPEEVVNPEVLKKTNLRIKAL